MNILITAQVYPPEFHPTGVMVRELAIDLARRGHQVTVATGYPHHPYGRLYPGYKKNWLQTENQNGVRVMRVWHLINPGPSLLTRALVMASQTLAFFIAALKSSPPEVIIAGGPPIIGPLVSGLVAKRYRAKLVSFIYDIYPDIAVELGWLKNPTVIKAAQSMEKLMYQWSERIIILSDKFRDILISSKGVEPEKLAVIPLWLDGRDVEPMDRDNPWRKEREISPDKFVVLYSGTIGLVSGAEVVLDAAQQLTSHPDILFLMVGNGFAKDQVEAQARQAGLKNICFLPLQPRECLSELQATSDVSLVTLAPGRGRTSVPSKVLGYMAAARPVIAAVDSDCDTAGLVRIAGCGKVVHPGQGKGLADAIIHYYCHSDDRQNTGGKGRQYFLENFERQVVLNEYINLIESLSISN
jgi:colanic acid biosynthesis glycosyl transferase WcaI